MTGAGGDSALNCLREVIAGYGPLLVAYSGGVDSSVVMKVAHEQLGNKCLAVIARSPSMAQAELHQAIHLARDSGFPLRILDTSEFQDPQYIANTGNRCYVCKHHLFAKLRELASADGWETIADGVHLDDLKDHVHGIRAAEELGVRSPLRESQLNKAAVREIARSLGLCVWDKPAAPCLASRIPVGTPVTVARLRQVDSAEQALARLGFTNFRVRHHGEVARIELFAPEFPRAIEQRDEIVAQIRAAGFHYVTLDLAGRGCNA